MNNIITKIKKNWILLIIIIQPLLDIISYFQAGNEGTSYTWVIRIAILLLVALVAFIRSKNKLKLILMLSPIGLYFVIHLANLYRINELNIIDDVRCFIQVFQVPVLVILLVDYIKNTNYNLDKIKKGILYSFTIVALSIILAYVTNTYQPTYLASHKGVTGWFSSANTASMILSAICPWAIYMLSNNKRNWLFVIVGIVATVLLFSNATRACYFTLLGTLVVLAGAIIVSKDDKNKVFKVIVLIVLLISSVLVYKISPTLDRATERAEVAKDYSEKREKILTDDNINVDSINKKEITDEEIVKILKLSYLYEELIKIHGEERMVQEVRPYFDTIDLSNNRTMKVINAKIEYEDSDTITKLLGIGYSRIQANSLDMENDIQALFYYYGYVGIAIYAIVMLYIAILAIRALFKSVYLIQNKEFIILSFIICLLILGGEYSGAFLRKSNANIYLALYLVLLYFNVVKNTINNVEKKKDKVTFLLLHLGYGGIETATINTANALVESKEVELISLYKLENNQEQYLNKNVKVKYLYEGGPNREEFLQAVKKKNIIKIFKEGLKSIDILMKKQTLIIEEILKSDAKVIVSTRYDFSPLLSKYGAKDSIKIAQEHHHHNNNQKYINILKKKYKNIDYLFALTDGLKSDYEKFLDSKNEHTKVITVPNMINNKEIEISDLKAPNIISVCRLHEGKRINELIDIFANIKNKEAKLFLIGDGDEQANLKNQIEELGLEDRVVMTGYLNADEQQQYWNKSSVYAMTSISEGLPMVLLEAMTHGIPCIAYKTDAGVTDIVKNEQNGYVIHNRNKEEYIKKLNELISNETLRNNMKIQALETVSKFSKDEVLKIWNTVLSQDMK